MLRTIEALIIHLLLTKTTLDCQQTGSTQMPPTNITLVFLCDFENIVSIIWKPESNNVTSLAI